MKLIAVLSCMLATAAFLVTGCEMFSPEGGASDQTALLEEYGGFTTDNEAPGFGDADLMSSFPGDEPYGDEMENHPAVTGAMRNGGARHYALRIVWGNLESPDTTATDAEDCPISDWSGSVVVDGGVLIVKCLIRFDPGDYIVRPRKGPREVEWVSHTKDHVDGIVFKIIDVPDPRTVDAKNTVTITTPFYTAEIPLEDLEDYREFIQYDDCNKISVVATEITPVRCPRGFMEGLWVAETDTSGHFKGAWLGNEGMLIGYLKCRYTIRDGKRVLFGNLVTRSGDFRGLLKGTWTPLGEETGPSGYFEGRWVDETYTVKGFFRGHYCICREDGTGFFHGRWIKNCR